MAERHADAKNTALDGAEELNNQGQITASHQSGPLQPGVLHAQRQVWH